MTYMDGLTIAANWATILTAAIASAAYSRFVWGQWERRNSLEAYLRKEKLSRREKGLYASAQVLHGILLADTEPLKARDELIDAFKLLPTDTEAKAGTADPAHLYYRAVGRIMLLELNATELTHQNVEDLWVDETSPAK